MNKITYLFGAGASKNALPIVNEIPERLSNLISLLDSESLILDDNISFPKFEIIGDGSKRDFQISVINDLKWLHSESARHSSIDTFAKKLTIRREFSNLEKLKTALSVFLICEQALKDFDNRYDSFLSSIINNDGSLPENIRILSWNYDYQFEIAYSEYSGNKSLYENQSRLNVKQKIGYTSRFNGFCITKLNGTTDLHVPRDFRQFTFVEKISSSLDKEFVEEIVHRYALLSRSDNVKSTLSFAWESEPNIGRSFLEMTEKDINNTLALVVIGYSFPFFNREIDRKIIRSMTQLRKVYLQSPEADALEDRFKAIKDDLTNIEIVKVKDVGQFYLPNEL